MLFNLLQGASLIFTGPGILAIFAGTCAGMLLGATPGLTGTMAIALLIPLTYHFPPVFVLPMMVGMYKGSIFGGSIPAILINTPGTPAAAATAIEGYALTKKGKAGKAMQIALYSSFAGDCFSDIVLILIAAPLASVAIRFGPIEMAALVIFSLTVIGAIASSGSMLKGLISAAAGLFLGTIGTDPVDAVPRLSFGQVELLGGISLIPFLIGLLAMPEVFVQAERGLKRQLTPSDSLNASAKDNLTWAEFKSCTRTILRSACIGTFLGALPGIGPAVAAYLGYGEAKRSSKQRGEFGHGSLEGVAACEAANNAVCGANLIPLVTLGIPGDVTAAVLLGAFMIHGLRPGPLLMREQAPLLYALFIGLLVANVVYLTMGRIAVKAALRVTSIRADYLMPVVAVLCVVGSYSYNFSMFDVWTMLASGVLGYLMAKGGFNPATLLIAFILSPMLEYNIRLALIVSDGRLIAFIQRPISLVLLVLATLLIGGMILRQIRDARGRIP